MKGSIKSNFIIINGLMVVIFYITTITLCGKFLDFEELISLKNIIILILFIIISSLVNGILSNMVINPLKKIEKNM